VIVLDKAVPVYRVLFEQHNVVPPARTQAIFAFSDYCSAYFVGLIFVAMVIDAAVIFTLGFAFPKNRRLLTACSHLWLLVALAALVCTIAWLTNPIVHQYDSSGVTGVAASARAVDL
jgi:type II secretory pathway component PulF